MARAERTTIRTRAKPYESAKHALSTVFLLAARYDGRPVVSVAEVCRDFFGHLTPEQFIRKATAGDIPLPLVRAEASAKAARSVHISDLASYLDGRREEAKAELDAALGR